MKTLGDGGFLDREGNWGGRGGFVAQPHFLSTPCSLVANASDQPALALPLCLSATMDHTLLEVGAKPHPFLSSSVRCLGPATYEVTNSDSALLVLSFLVIK